VSLPTAVLWDMDGTLVDTEPYWIECEYALVEAHGGVWGQHHAEALVGQDLLTSARYIRQHGGVDLSPEAIVQVMLDGVVDKVRTHIPWRPGALELLTELADLAIPCALVTMSYRRLAQTVIDALPAERFATMVAGDDVTHGKPHPEPYLLAAERLGVRPGDCVAIEDSPTGLASATAAGVPALGVEYLVPLEPIPGGRLTHTLVGVTARELGRLPARLRPAG
jgi:HAD superfamily hydrolase (TIGR01509 family)